MKKTYILGISALYHNSAAALICDGKIICAAEEERFSRKKGDSSFPIQAATFCLDKAGIQPENLAAVVFYENPAEKFGRIVTSALACVPKSVVQFTAAVPEWISDKLWIEKKIRKELDCRKLNVMFVPHHISHAASAFFPSPFEEAAVLTADGVGEWNTLTFGHASGSSIKIEKSLDFPASPGIFYSAFTYYTGFRINNGEYKMMGLAPYGKPAYVSLIKEKLIKIADDGSFILNGEYFSYSHGIKTINSKFEKLFGHPARKAAEEITQFYADIAASVQEITNEILLKTARYIKETTGMKNLCMAGGVALNVTATGLLRQSGIFDSIWIQPAAGDAGCAVGAALYAYYRITGEKRTPEKNDSMKGCFLGYNIAHSSENDDTVLKEKGAVWKEYSSSELPGIIADFVAKGKIVSVARDEAEFGPRALGHRSILADARRDDMLQNLNMKIKFREGFRPFAPAVLKEDAASFFDITGESPYMLFTFPVSENRRLPALKADSITKTASLRRSDIPAVTHIDYSARIQTVDRERNPFFYDILCEFKKITGCSIMVNTSFNTAKEPIVNNAADAYVSFMLSGADICVIGNRILLKNEQPGGTAK